MDDLYELERKDFLSPFNRADGFDNPDNDALTNSQEYLRGTDPASADTTNWSNGDCRVLLNADDSVWGKAYGLFGIKLDGTLWRDVGWPGVLTPMQVSNSTDWESVYPALTNFGAHALAIRQNGTLWYVPTRDQGLAWRIDEDDDNDWMVARGAEENKGNNGQVWAGIKTDGTLWHIWPQSGRSSPSGSPQKWIDISFAY